MNVYNISFAPDTIYIDKLLLVKQYDIHRRIQMNAGQSGRETDSLISRSDRPNYKSGRRKRRCKSCLCTVLVLSIGSFIVFIIYNIVLRGTQSIKQQQKTQHKHDVMVERKYSKESSEKMEKLLNSRPTLNTKQGCQGTVLILPHCESVFKTVLGQSQSKDRCNILGLQRSYYLITQFGVSKRWPSPKKLYAFGSSFRRTRAIETVTPLQQYSKLPNMEEFSRRTMLVNDIASLITNGDICSSVLVVSTSFNSDIPEIASDLGCGPLNAGAGCPMTYDQLDHDSVWELRFVYDVYGDEGLNYTYDDNANVDLTVEPQKVQWRVFGNVVNMRFDPLAFLKQVGEFKPGTNSSGVPLWMNISIYE